MSLKSWKKEFYPRPFRGRKGNARNRLAAVKHSLRKWEGALKKNLERHGMAWRSQWGLGVVSIVEDLPGNELAFDAESCALCELYLFVGRLRPECEGCPLDQIGDCCKFQKSSYRSGSPAKMVRALRKALRHVEKNG